MGWFDEVISKFRPADPAPVPESWLFFTTQRQGQPVGVFSNVALADHLAALAADHVLVTLRCRIEAGGPVPGPEEDAALEKLCLQMERRCRNVGGLFLGRTTGGGGRCHYYLLPKSRAELADGLVGQAEKAGYRASVRLAPDAATAYANDLLPTPDEAREALDTMTLVHLANARDIATAPRPVEHLAVFAERQAAQGFADSMRQQGYTLMAPPADGAAWSVHLSHVSMTTPEAITPHTSRMDAEARRHGGKYTGWATHPITST